MDWTPAPARVQESRRPGAQARGRNTLPRSRRSARSQPQRTPSPRPSLASYGPHHTPRTSRTLHPAVPPPPPAPPVPPTTVPRRRASSGGHPRARAAPRTSQGGRRGLPAPNQDLSAGPLISPRPGDLATPTQPHQGGGYSGGEWRRLVIESRELIARTERWRRSRSAPQHRPSPSVPIATPASVSVATFGRGSPTAGRRPTAPFSQAAFPGATPLATGAAPQKSAVLPPPLFASTVRRPRAALNPLQSHFTADFKTPRRGGPKRSRSNPTRESVATGGSMESGSVAHSIMTGAGPPVVTPVSLNAPRIVQPPVSPPQVTAAPVVKRRSNRPVSPRKRSESPTHAAPPAASRRKPSPRDLRAAKKRSAGSGTLQSTEPGPFTPEPDPQPPDVVQPDGGVELAWNEPREAWEAPHGVEAEPPRVEAKVVEEEPPLRHMPPEEDQEPEEDPHQAVLATASAHTSAPEPPEVTHPTGGSDEGTGVRFHEPHEERELEHVEEVGDEEQGDEPRDEELPGKEEEIVDDSGEGSVIFEQCTATASPDMSDAEMSENFPAPQRATTPPAAPATAAPSPVAAVP
eukprot:Hpha_TRINITY_DN15982_c1_g10::TRINITY_DN15982_c1_g10_i2::g.75514::m.75514